jgi:hypothetical protein
MRNTWLIIAPEDLKIERRQLEDEGKDLASWLPRWEQYAGLDAETLLAPGMQQQAEALLDAAQALSGGGADEPSDLASIRKLRPDGPRAFGPLTEAEARDHIAGAWLGRVAGCLLGKPVEGVQTGVLWPFLKDTGQWPLTDYIRFTQPGETAKAHPWIVDRQMYDTCPHMPQDDDTNYTLTGVKTVDENGPGFTPCDAGQMWLNVLPLLRTCTAERVAYRNLALGMTPPVSATHRNPYREWIGAQIRADGFAYTALGNPERAAEFAWRDASVSHVKNGIYGEMFAAAMIAAAPFAASVPDLVRLGLSEIPAGCRLATAVGEALAGYASGTDYEAAIARVHQTWNEADPHDWCHTISNAVIVTLALLYGGEDFGTTICRAVQPGFDTDCNGATAGSILGMRLGARGVPKAWTERFHDTLETGLVGMPTVKVSEMADWTYGVYRKVLES